MICSITPSTYLAKSIMAVSACVSSFPEPWIPIYGLCNVGVNVRNVDMDFNIGGTLCRVGQ